MRLGRSHSCDTMLFQAWMKSGNLFKTTLYDHLSITTYSPTHTTPSRSGSRATTNSGTTFPSINNTLPSPSPRHRSTFTPATTPTLRHSTRRIYLSLPYPLNVDYLHFASQIRSERSSSYRPSITCSRHESLRWNGTGQYNSWAGILGGRK